jgi:uncharacterized membrane-anchored protein
VNLLPNLIESIKKAALDAVEASKPCVIVFGKVTSTSPLKINVEQKMTLTDAQLILTRNVTDFKTNITVDHYTEDNTHSHSYTDDGSSSTTGNNTHKHQIKGKKEITVHNSLVVGDMVLLLRMQGGQKYIVWDRLVT